MATASDVAAASLGLHAARLQSPYVTVLSRAQSPDAALGLLGRGSQRELVTIRCMRKTLHVLPVQLAIAAHAATVHFRKRDALRAVRNAKVSTRELETATRNILDLLMSRGPTSYRQIERELKGSQSQLPSIRLAIKLAWETGTLLYLNAAPGWNHEVRLFALTSELLPHCRFDIDRGSATRTLLEAYFDRYGPASIRDAMWWSGLSRGVIVEALRDSGREVVTLRSSWTESPLHMFRERFEEASNQMRDEKREKIDSIDFLAHEDVALKAYFESRTRYLGNLAPDSIFNPIGEVLPAILMGGKVMGVWGWNGRSQEVEWRLFSNGVSAEAR